MIPTPTQFPPHGVSASDRLSPLRAWSPAFIIRARANRTNQIPTSSRPRPRLCGLLWKERRMRFFRCERQKRGGLSSRVSAAGVRAEDILANARDNTRPYIVFSPNYPFVRVCVGWCDCCTSIFCAHSHPQLKNNHPLSLNTTTNPKTNPLKTGLRVPAAAGDALPRARGAGRRREPPAAGAAVQEHRCGCF